MNPRTKFSKMIAAALKESGRSSKELAEHLKITRTHLSNLRNHQMICSRKHALEIFVFFRRSGIQLSGMETALGNYIEPLKTLLFEDATFKTLASTIRASKYRLVTSQMRTRANNLLKELNK